MHVLHYKLLRHVWNLPKLKLMLLVVHTRGDVHCIAAMAKLLSTETIRTSHLDPKSDLHSILSDPSFIVRHGH